MKLKHVFAILLLTVTAVALNAQIRYGFKTGLNFAHFNSPSETNDAGADLETWKNVTGFHIGATFSYHFTDNYSMRAELLYSKKGAKYTFDGQSYRVFRNGTSSVVSTGNSRYLININNSYLDFPLMGVARFGDFELSAGAYVSFLVGSIGDGSLRYSGKTIPKQNDIINKSDNDSKELVFNINHNYRKDDPGKGDNAQEVIALVDGVSLELPKTLGAYYDYPEDKGTLYKGLDYGLTGGVSYYLSSSLYAGFRIQYGMADITNDAADLSKARINEDGTLIYRNDKDKNFAIQASVGFSF